MLAIGAPTDAAPDLVARLRAGGCVHAEQEARLLAAAATGPTSLEAMVRSRLAGLPLEHVTGFTDFAGLRVAVGPGVFVPRRRTELLVREAARIAGAGAVLVDLCCGAGAVAAAVAKRAGHTELYAVDLDPTAVACARGNLMGTGAHVLLGDLYTPLPRGLRGRVGVLTANAPYVPTAELPLLPAEAREHEPGHALDGGADGLDIHRRVIRHAASWLAPAGHLLVEVAAHQAAAASVLMARHGLRPSVVDDPALDATVVVGRRRTPAR